MKIKALLSTLLIIILLGLAFPTVAKITYAAASGTDESARNELEEKILNTTVRVMVESWVVRPGEGGYDIERTVGHGTVMDGRYLVTHNHFDVPLSILRRQRDEASYGVVYLYNSAGELLYKGPLSDFKVAREDVETLVLANKDARFFEELGFASAVFAAWPSLALAPGMEVAQVDWDGERARVDWVKVKDIIADDGAPRLVLADGVLPGASGGGIFWQGMHVANNWRLEEKLDGSGAVVEALSAAALNPAWIIR